MLRFYLSTHYSKSFIKKTPQCLLYELSFAKETTKSTNVFYIGHVTCFPRCISLTTLLSLSGKRNVFFLNNNDKCRISRIFQGEKRLISYTVAAGVKFEVNSLQFHSRFSHFHRMQFWKDILYIHSFSCGVQCILRFIMVLRIKDK